MDSVDSRCECYVQAIVDQNARWRSGGEIADLTHQFEKLACGQILFANLNHVAAGSDGVPGIGEDITLPAVRHVIANHSAVVERLINDFQKYRSSDKPSKTSMAPRPDTPPRTKLFRRRLRSRNE